MLNISNSEVSTWLSCERMWVFAFGMDLAPADLSKPLARGVLGHLYFEYYVKHRIENGAALHSPTAHAEAMQYAQKAFKEAMETGTDVALVMETQFLVERYMNFHEGWPYRELLGSEQRLDLQLTDTLNLPTRYDLYSRDIRTNKYRIEDYKFTYDFWSERDHDVNGQMPKYIAVMKAAGMRVDEGNLIQIRTRPLGAEKSADAKNLWRETRYVPSLARVRAMLKQHVQASHEIEKFRNENVLPEEMLDAAIALYNKHGSCRYCNFADLCNSVTEGASDLSVNIRTSYTKNSYGYADMPAGELI